MSIPLGRDVRYICMNFFDRYFSLSEGRMDIKEIKNISMAILSLSIKYDGEGEVNLEELARHCSSSKELLIQHELSILKKLGWKLLGNTTN
jgi:hypothetical protein